MALSQGYNKDFGLIKLQICFCSIFFIIHAVHICIKYANTAGLLLLQKFASDIVFYRQSGIIEDLYKNRLFFQVKSININSKVDYG